MHGFKSYVLCVFVTGRMGVHQCKGQRHRAGTHHCPRCHSNPAKPPAPPDQGERECCGCVEHPPPPHLLVSFLVSSPISPYIASYHIKCSFCSPFLSSYLLSPCICLRSTCACVSPIGPQAPHIWRNDWMDGWMNDPAGVHLHKWRRQRWWRGWCWYWWLWGEDLSSTWLRLLKCFVMVCNCFHHQQSANCSILLKSRH